MAGSSKAEGGRIGAPRTSWGHPESAPVVEPIETFLDELPLIDEFLADDSENVSYSTRGPEAGSTTYGVRDDAPMEVDADGWAEGSWQSYDWHGLAALGTKDSQEDYSAGDAAWSATDWGFQEARRAPPRDSAREYRGHPTADEVAHALDSIARQIRSGELSIDQFRGTPPEAALAASLAAMLTLRR